MSVVKSFSVGNGDTYYIKHGSDNFSMIDCNLEEENADDIIEEIRGLDISGLTPLEALNILSNLQNKIKNRW